MLSTNKNVVFVKGYINGAIYNFNDGEIYSINSRSCLVIEKIYNNEQLSDEENAYANLLIKNGLLNSEKSVTLYYPEKRTQELDLCWLEITQFCNCRCVHCYEGSTHNICRSPLTLTEWKNVIEQIDALGVKRVVIIGGEPCIHKDIVKIADYVSSKNINTTIFTNGIMVSDSLKNVIEKYNIKMKFSLYGHCAEVHDRITKHPGSFDKLHDSIRFCIDHDIDTTIAVVIMRENEEYYNDILEFIKKIGVKKFKFDVIREVFGGSQSKHIPCDKNIIDSVKRTQPHFPKTYKKKFDNAFYSNTCWRGKIVISEDGTVLPCVFERNIKLGSIRTDTISNILNSEKATACWNFTYDKIKSCRDCEFRFACKDCRPLARASSTLYAKNPRCTYDVYSGEWK